MIEAEAWKLDDKDWVKDRKVKWKAIQKKLDVMLNLDNVEKKALKRYFLTGDEGRNYSPDEENERDFSKAILSTAVEDEDYPIKKISGYMLFILWFYPD